MLNDFIPVIHRLKKSDYPQGIRIIPISDAHYGSKEFNEVMWHGVIKRIQDEENCFCVLVGDLIDNGLKNSLTNVYEATCTPGEQKEWLYNELKPIARKVLAAVGGNHERRTAKEADQDPMYDVLARLGREDIYRRDICFMQVKLTYQTKDEPEKQRCEAVFAITHGAGGGQYIGSSANRVQNLGMAIDGIDCLVTGHTHKPVTFPVAKLAFSNGKVIRRQFVVAVASSFLDYGGYPVQKLMPPTAHAATEIIMTYTKQNGIPEARIRVLQ